MAIRTLLSRVIRRSRFDKSSLMDLGSFDAPPVEWERSIRLLRILALGSAVGVIGSICVEDGDVFMEAIVHRNLWVVVKAIGGIGVAVFIALEVLFGELASGVERKTGDWYANKLSDVNSLLTDRRALLRDQKLQAKIADTLREVAPGWNDEWLTVKVGPKHSSLASRRSMELQRATVKRVLTQPR